MSPSHTATVRRRLLMLVPVVISAVSLCAAAPAAAQSTASMSGSTVQIVGGPENNDISFGGHWLLPQYITDTAGIVAGPGCDQLRTTEVQCPGANQGITNYTALVAHLGRGDDTFAAGILEVPITVYGDDGNDQIYAGSVADTIDGGSGNDYINGNGGNDRIDGGTGDDTIYAGGGDTTITGGPGRDSIHTGDKADLNGGNSTVYAQDGEVDQVDCSTWGADTVYADVTDIVDPQCVHVIRGGTATPSMKLSLKAATHATIAAVLKHGYRFTCGFAAAGSVRAQLSIGAAQARKLGLGKKGVTLASVRGSVDAANYAITLHVVGRRYRARLARAGRVIASLFVVAIDDSGHVATASRQVRLTR